MAGNPLLEMTTGPDRKLAALSIPTSSPGHAPASSPSNAEPTFHPDYSVGAGGDSCQRSIEVWPVLL